MKSFTIFTIIASAALAVGAALPNADCTTTTSAKPTPTPQPTNNPPPSSGSGQCSGAQQPACCNGDSLLGLDCTLTAVLGTCNGQQACCNVNNQGLINIGALSCIAI